MNHATTARAVSACLLIASSFSVTALASEIWVAPTHQADVGGLGVGSNVVWPVTPAGAVRLAWAVPNDLQTFQNARLVLIPEAAGASTLTVFICPAQSSELAAAGCAGPFNHGFTGVANQLTEVDISTTVAPRVGVPGATYLSVLAFTAPTTGTDRIVGLRFAYDPVTPAGAATLGGNTFSGVQIATAFVGDGSGLTNLPVPAGVATLFANTFTATQTIDGGNLDLDPSTATTGIIMKNGTRFLHNFGSSNTFLGENAGNFTTTGVANTASGVAALQFNTDGGFNTAHGHVALRNNTGGNQNTAIGAQALGRNTGGSFNTASGNTSLLNNTTGVQNTAVGVSALQANTTGDGNTATGVSALFNSTGDNNVAIGFAAGIDATTGSGNIYLGTNVTGVAGESNTMYLGKQGVQTKTVIAGIRDTALIGGEMVLIDAAGRLGSGPVGPGASTVGTSQVIDDSLTASDLAPNAVGASEVAFNYAGSASKGGAASDLACVGCVAASEIGFAFAGLAANTFTGPQTINGSNLDLDPSTATAGNITKSGARFLHNFGTLNTFLGVNAGNLTMTGLSNTAIGAAALQANTVGDENTASGRSALSTNTSGRANTAHGSHALWLNTEGALNTASGAFALQRNTTGDNNTASGWGALGNNTIGSNNMASGQGALNRNTAGDDNTAGGVSALFNNTTGNDNTAIGANALTQNETGSSNVAVGHFAGLNATTGSFNIYLGGGVTGVAGESHTMYLGKVGTQTRTFIAGVRGVTTGSTGAVNVVIDANGQLGTVSSSRRVKEDIRDMGMESHRVLSLRPVTFRYTQPFASGAKPIQYGLIAEEVAEVFPDLVVRNADGQVETVQYQTLSVLLLNELQRLQRRVEALDRQIADLRKR